MIMKTRLIVIAALCGALLCSCGNRNKKAQKESVYKETIELTTVEGDHNLEATRIKIADSLVKDPKAGAVINERYTGMLPAADGPGIDYDLTIVRQEGVTRGVYALVTTYIEGENGRDAIFTETGRFVTLQGEGPNKGTEYLELTPSDDSTVHYFLKEKDGSLTMVGKDLKRDGHIGDVGQDLLGKRAVIRHAALFHKGRVGRETLNVAVLVHVEHALEVCTVSEHLDCHLPDSFRLHMGVKLLNTLPTFIKA